MSVRMRTRLRACFLVCMVACAWGGALAPVSSVSLPPSPDPPPGPPSARVLRAGTGGVTIEWVAPEIEVRVLDDGTVEVVVPGYEQTEEPGAPRLPFASSLIALPPASSSSLHITSVEESERVLPGPISVAPRPEGTIRDAQGRPIGGAFAALEGAPGLSGTDAPVKLEEVGRVRGVRLARVTFYPARVAGDRLRVVRLLQAEVRWDRPAARSGASTSFAPDDVLLRQVRDQVLNPQHVVPMPSPVPRDAEGSFSPESVGPAQRLSSANGYIASASTALIEVEDPGLYRVEYSDLADLGFSGVDPMNLCLFQGDEELAIEWAGDADAVFEPDEAFLFYAEPRFSRWTSVDVYRLVDGDSLGRRITIRSADPAGLPSGVPWVERKFEENHIYTPDCFCGHLPLGRDGDRWTWEVLRFPDRADLSLPFDLQAVDGQQLATLTLWLIGYTDVAGDPDHRVDVSVNGTSVGWVQWDGRRAITATLDIPAGSLRSGQNTLALSLPGLSGVTVEGAWVDAFAVRYGRGQDAAGSSVRFGAAPVTPGAPAAGLPQRIYLPLVARNMLPSDAARAYTVALGSAGPYRGYDITEPLRPRRLTAYAVNGNVVSVGDPPGGSPRRYFIVSDAGVRRPVRVRAPEQLNGEGGGLAGADVLIITHPAFSDALGPLVSLRRSQGLATSVIDVLGIYDTYGDGRPAPPSIRAFLADAYATWTPRPTYVLLVGDGSFDPRGYRAGSSTPFIPPYLADVDPWAGETAADNLYASVDGSDHLPDLLIGRLPVQTPEDARSVVDKIVEYESHPVPGVWNADVLLVADDADTAGDFADSSQSHAAAHVTPPFSTTAHYCDGTSPYLSDCSSRDTTEIGTAVLSRWNQGALLVQFTGHASWHQWAAERFFHLDDLAELRNGSRLPVVVEMTCFTGAFHRPEPTLDESLVVLDGGGAVAAWGATGLGVGTGHARLSDGFFGALFSDKADIDHASVDIDHASVDIDHASADTLGQATLSGKLTLASSGKNLDLLDTFTLLGDPAMAVNLTLVPWARKLFLPLVLGDG